MKTFKISKKDLETLMDVAATSMDGLLLYNGVLIPYVNRPEKDLKYRAHEDRLCELLDVTPLGIINQMAAAFAFKGSVGFLWKDEIPEGYEYGQGLEVPDGDYWGIFVSKVCEK